MQVISNLTIPPRETKVEEATKLRGAANQTVKMPKYLGR